MKKEKDLRQYLSQQQEKFLEELTLFCQQPSIAASGEGMEKMPLLVQDYLKGLGAEVEVYRVADSYPIIFAELKSPRPKAPTLFIYNHYDVQPPDPLEAWTTPPFAPEVRHGHFYARGVGDNKGNLLSRLQVIGAWQKVHGELPLNIKWVIEGEEEIGSPHLQEFAEKYGYLWQDSDFCLWETGGVNEKGEPILNLGMKGIVYLELSCHFNNYDLHSGLAAIADSPVWRLIQALNTLRDEKGQVLIRDFYEHRQPLRESEEEMLRQKDFDPASFMASKGIQRALVDPQDKVGFLKQMYLGGTVNICGIWGGFTQKGVKTIVPSQVRAKIDLRLVRGQKTDDIVQKLRRHLDSEGFSDIEIKLLASQEGGQSDITDFYIQETIKILRQTYQKEVDLNLTNLGSGPIYFLASQFNIPVIQIGCGYPGSQIHAPDENVRLTDYWQAQRAFAALLENWL